MRDNVDSSCRFEFVAVKVDLMSSWLCTYSCGILQRLLGYQCRAHTHIPARIG